MKIRVLKKTLEEKLAEASCRHNGVNWDEIVEICRNHFLEALPNPEYGEYKYGVEDCRKAIEEAK